MCQGGVSKCSVFLAMLSISSGCYQYARVCGVVLLVVVPLLLLLLLVLVVA